MKPEIAEILLNKEAIAVDQDPLGKQGSRVKDFKDGREVWARPLSGGAWAVCLFNRTLLSQVIEVRWSDLGLKEDTMKVRDLWTHHDLGVFNQSYSVSVPSHAAVLLKVRENLPTYDPPQDTWRIRPGGDSFTDHSGHAWSEDKGFEGGQTAETTQPVEAKADPELYQTERWGPDFSYVLPVKPGKYQVRLKFTEAYVKEKGQRLFSVMINGKKVLEHFDIFDESKGFLKGIDKSFMGIEPDAKGLIRIRFVAEVQNAKVCAIEIRRQN
jgi:hypothetical protein